MPKREREEDDAHVPSAKQRRIRYKLKVGITKLGHAFKVSKGFERQKLGRRRKTAAAQSHDQDVHRIDSEIAALKALDTALSAQQLLFKSLLRIKAVADHEDLPAAIRTPIKASTDPAALNVNARLCKANQVQDALSTALSDVQQSLGLDAEKSKSSKPRRLRAKDVAAQRAPKGAVSYDEKASQEPQADGGDLQDSPRLEDSEDEDFGDLDGLLAPGSEDESAPESGREGTMSKAHARKEPEQKGYSLEADLSLSGSEMESRSPSPEPERARATKQRSYLPSLTMAGYVSGSESDIAEDIDLAPRKNRRGQRARQQIWEQKYGSGAKHLQRKDGSAKWDAKRGAVDGNDRRGARRDQRARRASPEYAHERRGNMANSNAGSERAKKKPIDPNAPVHPSWEAAKKAKEKREAPVAFQGKKITFD